MNSYTTGHQRNVSVGQAANGDFVIVWDSSGSNGSDVSYESVLAQRFAADGSPLGGELQVNSYTTGNQLFPSVGVASSGDFIVVWESYYSDGSDTSGFSIQGRRFAADGTPLGTQFQVNSYTTDDAVFPDVSVADSGEFVVVWESYGSMGTDTSYASVQGQRYSTDATPLGGEFQVNTYTIFSQERPSVAMASSGGFVATWTDAPNVRGQRYDSNGDPLAAEFQINSAPGANASLEMASQGDFMVVWEGVGSTDTDTSDSSIQGRRFATDGTPLGGEFQVNTFTPGRQELPYVTVDEKQSLVVWLNVSPLSIRGQQYSSDGTRIGAELGFAVGPLFSLDLAGSSYGELIVVWDSYGSVGTDTDLGSIHGQRYVSTLLFADGFEAGDVSRWSGEVSE